MILCFITELDEKDAKTLVFVIKLFEYNGEMVNENERGPFSS